MYDSPKAVHFRAAQDGQYLPNDSSVGLSLRWHVAKSIRDAGIEDMLRLTDKDKSVIASILQATNLAVEGMNLEVSHDSPGASAPTSYGANS